MGFGKRTNHADNTARQLENTQRAGDVVDLPSRLTGTKADNSTRWIPLSQITAKLQIRTEFDPEALQELANSLKEKGQQTACTVFWSEDEGKYVLVAGERRYRAAGIAELEQLKCHVLADEPSAEEHHELQLIENVQREDLKPIEEALAYQRLRDEFGYSQTQIAQKTGKNQSTISRALQTMKLPDEIIDHIRTNDIPRRLVEALIKAKDLKEQKKLIERYEHGDVTVHDAQRETATTKRGSSAAVASKNIRVKKARGIDLRATGKKKHTNTDYALATLDWCEDLATAKRASVDVDAIRNRLNEVLTQLNKPADLSAAAAAPPAVVARSAA